MHYPSRVVGTLRPQEAERLQGEALVRLPHNLVMFFGTAWLPADAQPRVRSFRAGALVIVPEEAEIIRRIFAEFIRGDSMREIANRLQDEHVPTSRMNGKWDAAKGSWATQRIRERLEAPMYCGDLGSRLHHKVRPGTRAAGP